MNIERFFNKLEANIVEITNNRNMLGQTMMEFSLEDNNQRKKWYGLKVPPWIGSSIDNKSLSRADCKWKPPEQGWIKLNFDGAARGNPGVAGIGICLHNAEGKILGRIEKPIGIKTNNEAEIEAIRLGLAWCKKWRLKRIVIEGDSAIIINAIRQGRTPNWKLNSAIDQLMESLEVIGDYIVNHIYKEGNTDVDKLANLGADRQEIEEIHESLKEELRR